MSDESMTTAAVWDLHDGVKLSGVCERLLKPPPPPPHSSTTAGYESKKHCNVFVDALRADGSQTERSTACAVADENPPGFRPTSRPTPPGTSYPRVTTVTSVTGVNTVTGVTKVTSRESTNTTDETCCEQSSRGFNRLDPEEIANGHVITGGGGAEGSTVRTPPSVGGNVTHRTVKESYVPTSSSLQRRSDGRETAGLLDHSRPARLGLDPAALAVVGVASVQFSIDQSGREEHSRSCHHVSRDTMMYGGGRCTDDDAKCSSDVTMTSFVTCDYNDTGISTTSDCVVNKQASIKQSDISQDCFFQDWNDRLRLDETSSNEVPVSPCRTISDPHRLATFPAVVQPGGHTGCQKRSSLVESKKCSNQNKTPDSEGGHSYGGPEGVHFYGGLEGVQSGGGREGVHSSGGGDSSSSSVSPSEGTRSDYRTVWIPARNSRSFDLLDDASRDTRYRRRRRSSSVANQRSKSGTRRSSGSSRVIRRALSIELTLTTVTTREETTTLMTRTDRVKRNEQQQPFLDSWATVEAVAPFSDLGGHHGQ